MIKGIVIYLVIAGLIVIIGNKLSKKKWFKILEVIVFIAATLFIMTETLKVSFTPTLDGDVTIEEITEEGE